MNKERCIFCMEEISDTGKVCPHCKKGCWEYRWQCNWLMPQTIVKERYFIGIVVGEGAFGITYLAWDIIEKRKVAVKVCSGDVSEEVRLLEKGGRIPGLVEIYDFFMEKEQSFLVMEYLSRGTLKKYVKEKKQGRLKIEEITKLLKPVMEALAFMHSVGIVHCDVSPDNILLDEKGQCRLIDLGAARQCGEISEKRLLKAAYAAPEQYEKPEFIGPWTDVYGLCAVIYELLTGEKPVSAADRLRQDTLKPVSFYEAVPVQTEQVLMRGLEPEIQKRYFGVELLMAGFGISVENVQQLGEAMRRCWGEQWLTVSSRGKRGLNAATGKKRRKRLRRKIFRGVLVLVCFGAVLSGSGYLWKITHPEQVFQWKLRKAEALQIQKEDMKVFAEQSEGYEECAEYLRKYGILNEKTSGELLDYYSMDEKTYMNWEHAANQYRKFYLDQETLTDALFYYTGAKKQWAKKEKQDFLSYIKLEKENNGQIISRGEKTVTYYVRFPGYEEGTLEDQFKISYDPLDERVYSTEYTTADKEKVKKFMVDFLKVCCPETYLTDEEAEEILEKTVKEDAYQILELSAKSFLGVSGYRMEDRIIYTVTAAAHKGCLW